MSRPCRVTGPQVPDASGNGAALLPPVLNTETSVHADHSPVPSHMSVPTTPLIASSDVPASQPYEFDLGDRSEEPLTPMASPALSYMTLPGDQEQRPELNAFDDGVISPFPAPVELPAAEALNQPDNERNGREVPVHQPQEAPLLCVSCNVQKSAANTAMILDQYRHADIVCVQEIYWGIIKTVASTVQRDGDDYYNTVNHPGFQCLGAHKDSRVAVYVNRKWVSAGAQVRDTLVKHNDVLCVTLHLPKGGFTFLNVYNDSGSHDAVKHLLERAEALPTLAFIAGDFNSRHRLWDQGERNLQRSRT